MAKEYLKKTVNRTAKPRSKRLQDLGAAAPSSTTSIVQTAGGTGGASAGSGHSHTNLPVLETIGTDTDGYAYLTQSKENDDGSVSKTTEKIKAGFADEAKHSEDADTWNKKRFIDYLDQAVKKSSDVEFNELLVRILASKGFVTGVSGWHLDEAGNAEMRSLVLRDSLRVPELRFNRMTYFEGYNVISPGGGFTVREVIDNGDGTFNITTDAEEGEPIGQYVDDILTGYWHNFNGGNSDIQGFGKMQFRVTAVDYESGVVTLSPKPAADGEETSVPKANLKLAQTGNFSNAERQTYIIIDVRDGSCCITFFDQVNTWEPEVAHMKSWFGKKKGARINGQDVSGYSAVLENVYMSGLIHQIDSITGESVRVPIDKGAWVGGKGYGYYDRVSHVGSLWLCIAEGGTKDEPSESSEAWLKQVSEGRQGERGERGETGAAGKSITNFGAWDSSKVPCPYMAIVTMGGNSFLCINPAGTSNPPMYTMTTNAGERLQTNDGGYILTGEINTNDYELLVKSGKDGSDGKDYEWIYILTEDMSAPAAPENNRTTDDFIPEGWSDNPSGVSVNAPYEWSCVRVKNSGIWGEWSLPAVWAKFGKDGESAVFADIDNEMDSIALTSEGKTTQAETLTTGVSMWYGSTRLPLKSIETNAAEPVTTDINLDSGNISFNVAAGVSIPSRTTISINITAEVNGADVTRTLIFTAAGVRAGSSGADGKDGKDGSDGADAVLYRLVPSVSSVVKKKDGSYSVGSVSCRRTKTVGGLTSDTEDGELLRSLDGASDVQTRNGETSAVSGFSKSIKYTFKVDGVIVDVESIPIVADGDKGETGDTPEIRDGYWWIGNENTGIKAEGQDGKPGTNGSTPEIRNGYWWINGVNTGVKAEGVDGKDGVDGKNGADGISISAGGAWKSGVTYEAMTIVTMGGHAWVAKARTSNPPMYTVMDKTGNRLLGKDGGYILTGEVNSTDWQLMNSDAVQVYLVSNVGHVTVSETTGFASMSAFRVYAKQSVGDSVLSFSSGYLVCKGVKSDGSIGAKAGPVKSSDITVAGVASDGYSTYITRCYKSQSDAQSWNENFSAEITVGKIVQARTGSEPRPRGLITAGTEYVWNDKFHDIGYYTFNGINHAFRVKVYNTKVTAVPTSVNGDDNWEAAQEFQFTATDLLLSDEVISDRIFSRHIKVNDMEILDGCIIGEDTYIENGGMTTRDDDFETRIRGGYLTTKIKSLRNSNKYLQTEVGGCSGAAMMAFGGDSSPHCSYPYRYLNDNDVEVLDCGYYGYVPNGLAAWFPAGQLGSMRPAIFRAGVATMYAYSIGGGVEEIPSWANIIVATYASGTQNIYLPSSPEVGAWYKIINDYSRGSRTLNIYASEKYIESSSGRVSSIAVSSRSIIELHFDGTDWHRI